MNVLILGAGGLGCELLKNITMMGVNGEISLEKVTIIDMDTIELTNLNRQFMFTPQDIGKYKSQIAANYINKRFGSQMAHVEAIVGDLTTLDKTFYKQFNCIFAGLDAIEPRRFINQMCIEITHESEFEQIIPLIDGGVEALKGHVKVIVPGVTACWECSISTLPTVAQGQDGSTTHPLCTIATNPRTLEHVVEYVYIKALDEGGVLASGVDGASDVEWDQDMDKVEELLLQCKQRALEYNISDAKEQLTVRYMLGVMKKIIPNVSTTNAMVAAQCCLELYKIYHDLVDFEAGNGPHNFLMINGHAGQFHYSFTFERDPQCSVCSKLFPPQKEYFQ